MASDDSDSALYHLAARLQELSYAAYLEVRDYVYQGDDD